MTTPLIILGLLTGPLLLGTLLQRLTRQSIASAATLGSFGVCLVFLFTGVGHFIKTEPMAAMLPPFVPAGIPLVLVTGVIELAAAVAVLVPRWRRAIGCGLIVMLLLFLPVNVYAAMNRIGMGGHTWGPVYLLIRVPLQAILITWIWWFSVRPSKPVTP